MAGINPLESKIVARRRRLSRGSFFYTWAQKPSITLLDPWMKKKGKLNKRRVGGGTSNRNLSGIKPLTF